ncbi:MAG: DUF4097 family beta strand repeat protein [Bryobacterales bacterium]|nr:DUF4097 family beta strand repeat protein [Bryobacterales bacterium]
MSITRFLLTAPLLAARLAAQVEDTQTMTRQFPLAAGGAEAEVSVRIISGAIRVVAHQSPEVAMTAKVKLEAPDAAELAQLAKDVRLESEQKGNNIWIGVETAPQSEGIQRQPRELGWRGKSPAGDREAARRPRRSFRHDVELRVPRGAHLKLHTVNGEITVDGVAGEFHVNTVNGAIHMTGASGSGRAQTVNGPVTLAFAGNPRGPVSVKSVNGKVDLTFPPDLSADFELKTFNGRMTSDFPMIATAGTAAKTEPSEQGMKRIWRSGGPSRGRVGNGGPLVHVDSFNGGMTIHRKN